MIAGYNNPRALGHKLIDTLFNGTVWASEKIDGSNTGFGVGADGALGMRSHNQQLDMDACDKMFAPAVETVRALAPLLVPGYTYYGEVVSKTKHNTLKYGRCPKGFIIMFDIDKGLQDLMLPDEMAVEAARIGLESVPLLAVWNEKPSLAELNSLLETESILGSTLIEGFVTKGYGRFDSYGQQIMGKYVSAQFKETNAKDFRSRNPTGKDMVQNIVEMYGTEARWMKALQHLREDGKIQDAPEDIGILLREVSRDVLDECGDDIMVKLFKHFWTKDISKGLTKNLPSWYKQQLISIAFPE